MEPNENNNDAPRVPGLDTSGIVPDPTLPWYQFDGVRMAQGYNLLGIGRGAVVMSNIFLSTSFIYLASQEAGCLDADGEVIDDCDNRVHGSKPAALVSNIAVVSGVLSAVFMPFVGAMLDYTDHRKTAGIAAAVMLVVIHGAQIGTKYNTWFAMAILQAIAGFIYQVQVMATYAYLPDIARVVGQRQMTKHSSTFVMFQFAAQSSFLVLVIALSIVFFLDDVITAQLSQGINLVWTAVAFYFGWKYLPACPAAHELPQGQSLLKAGFVQTYHTAIHIRKTYGKGLWWFLWGVMFAEAAAYSFTVVSVVYLNDHMNMDGTQIGVFFLITLLASLPGTKLGSWVTARTDPNKSWRLSMMGLIVVTIGGSILVDRTKREVVSYLWGLGIGVLLGWFYPTQGLFFSMCLPKGHEAELSGFYVYCTQILSWMPPLLFTLLVENDVSQTYGVMSVTIFFVIAILILMCAAPWEEILEESGRLASEDSMIDESQVPRTEGLGDLEVSNIEGNGNRESSEPEFM